VRKHENYFWYIIRTKKYLIMKKAIPVFTALLLTASYFSAEAQTRVHLSRQPAASEQQPAGQQIIAQKKPVTVNDDEANAWRETRYQTTTLHLTPEQEQKVYGIDLAFFKKLSERRTAGDPLISSEHR
jgi:hypothetical protein